MPLSTAQRCAVLLAAAMQALTPQPPSQRLIHHTDGEGFSFAVVRADAGVYCLIGYRRSRQYSNQIIWPRSIALITAAPARDVETPLVGEGSIDLELVQRVQAGDQAAFNLLVIRYQHRIANLVARFIAQPDEVQDVTQEAFIKAYRGLANFRGDSAFYTWLYRIAVNTAKNHLVASSRRASEGGLDVQEAEQFDGASLLQDAATPERELLSEEIRDTVQGTIAALPEELRVAITLRELEGLSYEEIAAVMECPIGTVRSRIFRAREAVQRELKPLLNETGLNHEANR